MIKPCDNDTYGELWQSARGNPHLAQMTLNRVDLETQLASNTPLEQAYLLAKVAQTGNMSLAKRLLVTGCNTVLSKLKHSPVPHAVKNGNTEIAEALIRCSEDPVSELDLSSAAKRGRKGVVLGLLRKVRKKEFQEIYPSCTGCSTLPRQVHACDG